MNKIADLQKLITEFIAKIDFSGTPHELYDPIVYTMSQGGKRIRPTLALLACEMFGGDVNDCLAPALAAEVFHNFTLVHDDIMDQAPIRRGKATVYQKWNSNIAILAGDVMQVKALELAMTPQRPFTYAVLQEMTKVAREVCEGQQFDLNFETQETVTLDEYIEMIRLKTAVLLGSVLKIGCIVAGADDAEMKKVYDFGIDLGLAFQLQDDLFDCYGDEKTFGKKPGGDIAENKKTYLYLKALELADENDKRRLVELFHLPAGRDEKKQKEVLQIYEKYHVRQLVEQVMTNYYNRSLTHLDALNVSREKQSVLRDYAKILYFREK